MTEKLSRYYKAGLRRLLAVLGKDHPRSAEVLILQHRLMQNLADTSAQGATSALETSRARLLESCNRLSQTLVGKSFYALCGLSPTEARKTTGILSSDLEERAPIDLYFDAMNELLQLEELQKSQAGVEARDAAREQTLAILLELNGAQKAHVVQFLYEAGLITEGPGVLFLSGADLTEAHLEGSSLIEAHLAGTNMRRSYLDAAHLEWARLGEAHLEDASLKRTFLVAAHLAGAYLQQADLENAHLLGANLSGADLTETNLTGAHLQWASLLTANLTGACLVNAHLVGAELQWANLADADLSRANLEEAHLSWARLRGARYDVRTRWPEGFDPIGAGAVETDEKDHT